MKKYLLIILLLGLGLRLFRFGSVPNELNRDEAALGYNAYSLAYYGVDEWHVPWPVAFKSFGDYKLPGYIYSLVPWVRIFGLKPWVVRLPSLIAGMGLILLAYLLARRWFKDEKAALLAATITATAPFAVFYSRMAYEANLGLFFLGLSLFFYSRPFRWLNLTLGSLFYFWAIFTYNTPLLLAPILAAFFFFFLTAKKQRWAAVVSILVIAGVGFSSLLPVFSQKQSITLLSDPTYILDQQAQYMKSTSLLEKAWNHRLVYYPRLMVERLLKSLSPEFLTQRGGANPWHSAPGTGHILWMGYGLWLLSLILFKKRLPIVGLLFLSFLPAIITVDAPHATRSLVGFYLMGILGALVVKKWPRLLVPLIILIIAEGAWYTLAYQTVMDRVPTSGWPVGLKQSLAMAPQDRPVVVTGRPGEDIRADQPYIFVLFQRQISPILFQDTIETEPADIVGLVRIKSFDGHYFLNDNEPRPENAFIIGKNSDGIYEPRP